MKKQSPWTISFLLLIIAVAAGGIFLICRHLGGAVFGSGILGTGPAASGTQTFSGDGYTLGVPASWYVEQSGKDTIAAYPNRASAAAASSSSSSSSSVSTVASAPTCKVEMSVFPYAPSTSVADWISARIGADPSLVVTERSSEDITINGGTGVKWNGVIDGAPTTLVYAFSKDHAYEIAPSVINETVAGNAPCADALQTFLSQLTIQ